MRKSVSTIAVVVALVACTAQQQQQTQSQLQNAASAAPSAIASAANAVRTNPEVKKAGRNLRDAALSAAVEAAIAGQAGLNVFHIGATAHNGVVTLTGTVSSAAIASTAVRTARHVRGVTRVVNRLNVR